MTFAAGLRSHEVKFSLSSIVLYCELVKKEKNIENMTMVTKVFKLLRPSSYVELYMSQT